MATEQQPKRDCCCSNLGGYIDGFVDPSGPAGGRLSALIVLLYKSVFYDLLLYGRAGRLTAKNGGFGPGQYRERPPTAEVLPVLRPSVLRQTIAMRAAPREDSLRGLWCRVGALGSETHMLPLAPAAGADDARDSRQAASPREKEIGGPGGSLEPPGPLLTHLHTVYMAYSECLPTYPLDPLWLRGPVSRRALVGLIPMTIGIELGHFCGGVVHIGLGRTVALYRRSSASYQIC
jgi:hypothetical protein